MIETMAESRRHTDLVNALYSYIVGTHADGDEGLVFVDDGSPGRRPPMIAGRTPDVFVPPRKDVGMILGEAETGRSLETVRTMQQIRSFMEACGTTAGSVFVLAVPWDRVRLALSIIRAIQREGLARNVTAIVPERLIV